MPQSDFQFREIPYASAPYAAALALREAVLRVPLGMKMRDVDLAGEAARRHFGLFAADGRLVACAAVDPRQGDQAQVRQVAVEPTCQGGGLGRRLMLGVEAALLAAGLRFVVLHARVSVAGFYEKLGYAADDDDLVEVGIPHRPMRKRLGD